MRYFYCIDFTRHIVFYRVNSNIGIVKNIAVHIL